MDLKIQHPDSEIIDMKIDGKISPEMNYEKSGRHIRHRIGLEHADDFDPNKSEILATAAEVDRVVSRLVGTRKVQDTRNSKREYVEIPELTGLINGNKTHCFVIIYSDSGWHLVPQNKKE